MNRSTEDLDARARALHAQAVCQVPARVLRELHARPQPGRARRSPAAIGWSLAGACAALVAVVAVTLPPASPPAGGATTRLAAVDADAGYRDAYAALDEDPDLYLWLASSDAQPLALE